MALHVVGHDGTDRGDDAVALARRLSGLYEAELLAVHVVGMPPTRDRFTGPVLDRLEDAAGVVLARARRGLGTSRGPRHEPSTRRRRPRACRPSARPRARGS